MSFVSYAQNYEDVMLWRALGHLEDGFYIDVGAWSPDLDSVTRAFYDRGWHGINLEPNPHYHALLQERRPRDINLALGAGETEGSFDLRVIGDTGLSTLDSEIANVHASAGREASTRTIQVERLAAIWAQHVPDGQPVHFLKIDVEGFEEAVIRGHDWQSLRPWIVVVEATKPLSEEPSYQEWEELLLAAGYLFAYTDKLNRYYVAKEHSELLSSFEFPPNVFDDFVRVAQVDAEQRAAAEAARAAQAEAQLADILSSKSWRYTLWLRRIDALVTRWRGRKG